MNPNLIFLLLFIYVSIVAKKFLTGKPEDKYAFFTKATELERIDRSYANTIDNINDLNTKKESVEQSMQSAIASVKKLKKEWEQFEVLDKMEDLVADTTLDLCWATYRDFEKDATDEEEVSPDMLYDNLFLETTTHQKDNIVDSHTSPVQDGQA